MTIIKALCGTRHMSHPAALHEMRDKRAGAGFGDKRDILCVRHETPVAVWVCRLRWSNHPPGQSPQVLPLLPQCWPLCDTRRRSNPRVLCGPRAEQAGAGSHGTTCRSSDLRGWRVSPWRLHWRHCWQARRSVPFVLSRSGLMPRPSCGTRCRLYRSGPRDRRAWQAGPESGGKPGRLCVPHDWQAAACRKLPARLAPGSRAISASV